MDSESGKGRFRILSLDGGGIKGAFTAQLLAKWEEVTGAQISDHFDMIAGTSTGGIIAIGLGLGIPTSEIVEFYRNCGPKIFPNRGVAAKRYRSLRHLFAPKYSQSALRDALRSVFGGRKFGESRLRLIITMYDAIRGRIFLMKTAHHPRFTQDYESLAMDVALTTSAAPTFFRPAEFSGHANNLYVDGGVWANNPVLAAVIEAHHFLEVPFEQMDVLSLGTTRELPNLLARLERGLFHGLPPGMLYWSRNVLGLLFNAQMESSLAMANLLTNDKVFRVDELVPDGWFSLDAADLVKEMMALGRGIAVERKILETIQTRFLNGTKALPFVPCHVTH